MVAKKKAAKSAKKGEKILKNNLRKDWNAISY